MRLIDEEHEKAPVLAQADEAEHAGEQLLADSLRGMAENGLDLARDWEELPGGGFLVDRRSSGSFWPVVALGSAMVTLVIGCTAGLSGKPEPKLSATDVEGVWSGSDGGRLDVRSDGSADLTRVMEPGPGCGQSADRIHLTYSGAASWVFDTYPDESPGIRFDYIGAGTGKRCSIYLSIVSVSEGGTGFLPHDSSQRFVREALRRD